jgi:hypothetical protein
VPHTTGASLTDLREPMITFSVLANGLLNTAMVKSHKLIVE